jgi:uncharacterized protein (TIGR03067 family)
MIMFRRTVTVVGALAAPGLVVVAPPIRASGVTALEGAWTVAQATVNGASRAEGKVLNATWTFRGSGLVVQSVHGKRLRATLSFDAAAEPSAFHVTPLDPPEERPLWIVWERRGDQLRLAFYDGVDRRPEDFGPRPKLVVLTLVTDSATPTPVALDPCAILRAAGANRLLGGPTRARPAQRRASTPGSSCVLDRTDGSSAISLALVAPPAGPAYVDAAREEANASRRLQIEDEPALGVGAFSSARGWTVVVVAHRRGTAMILTFEALRTERAELQRYAARVLDAL